MKSPSKLMLKLTAYLKLYSCGPPSAPGGGVRGPEIATPPSWSPRETSARSEWRKSQPMLGNVLPGALLQPRHSAPDSSGWWSHTARRDLSQTASIVRRRRRRRGGGNIQRHGSSENTVENDRTSVRQVQPDAVHGRPVRTTSGNFGSAGNEVRWGARPQHVRGGQ